MYYSLPGVTRGGGGRSYSQSDQPTAPVMQQQHNNSSLHSAQSLPPRYSRARDNNDDRYVK